jgi:hypothetical protein
VKNVSGSEPPCVTRVAGVAMEYQEETVINLMCATVSAHQTLCIGREQIEKLKSVMQVEYA